MKKYSKYKTTEIDWFKKIPYDWKITKVKFEFNLKKVPSKEKEPNVLSLTQKGIIKRDITKGEGQLAQDYTGYNTIEIGDIVLNPMDLESGAAHTSTLSGVISNAYFTLVPKDEKANADYYGRFFNFHFTQNIFYPFGKGVGRPRVGGGRWTLNRETLMSFPLLKPPLPTQTKIAEYLDRKQQQANNFIAKRQKMIELLKEQKKAIINKAVTKGLNPNVTMKDSGVEWLGEIPEHWAIRKIKRISQVKRGASPRPIDDPIYFDENGEYGWVRISDVTKSNKYLFETEQKLSKYGSRFSVKQEVGDIFISIAGSVGKPIITKIKCCIHDGFVWFDNLKYPKELLYYIFVNEECYKGLGKLGTQLNLNTDTIGDIYLPFLKFDEIRMILEYIKTKTSKIDIAISKAEEEIKLVKEYLESLIFNVVTGQKKV